VEHINKLRYDNGRSPHTHTLLPLTYMNDSVHNTNVLNHCAEQSRCVYVPNNVHSNLHLQFSSKCY